MNEIAIIINSHAKNAANASEYLSRFEEEAIPFQLYETESDKLESVIKLCVTQHTMILIGGGDGTIRTGAQYCAHAPITMGVLALGTLNHFAKELDLPQTADEMIAAIKQRNTLKIDLADVNGIIFVNNSSIGFYPKFADKRDHYSRVYNKWLSYIPSFFDSLKMHKAFTVNVKNHALNKALHTSFLMISNNLYTYEFPITIKRESFQQGLLGLYFFKQGKIRILEMIKGLFTTKNNFEMHQSKDTIQLDFAKNNEITISLDGDTMKVKTPLYYKSLPKALTLLTKAL